MERIEKTILQHLIYNEEYSRKVIPFINIEYFEQKTEKIIFEELVKFVLKYKTLITIEALSIEIENRNDLNETGIKEIREYISSLKKQSVDLNWLLDTTEKWCRDRAIYNALMESIHIADGNDDSKNRDAIPNILSNALAVSFDNNIGHDYLGNYAERYEYYHRKEDRIEFDLEYFNKITKGGLPSKTLNVALAGTGCHAKGTEVLMFDGTTKKVEEVLQTDVLMGNDGTPRYIQYLIRDKGQMYRIYINETGDEMVVNEDHILSLVNTTTKEIVNISVKDYVKKTSKFKHLHKSYYLKTPCKFSNKNLKIDPYFMGLYLGDGHTHSVAITNMDEEVLSYVKKYINETFSYISIKECNTNSKATTIKLIDNFYTGFGKRTNRISKLFNEYGINITQGQDRIKCENKFIPHDYKTSSISDRLNLLAGLIDSDGYKIRNGSYSVTTKSKRLSKDILFVSRSLCFGSQIKTKNVGGTNYYTVLITTTPESPNTIPCKIQRKKSSQNFTKNKNPLHKSFSVEKLGVDEYYGFNLTGNHLYCLDNFLVTHNTGKSLFMCHVAASVLLQGKNVLYITLEMAEERIAERIDSNLLNVPIQQLAELPRQTFETKINNLTKKTHGRLIIKEYPTASAHSGHFKALLNELSLKKSFKPDIIFIDYLNICASSRHKQNSSINSYTYIKSIAEELRGLAVEFNVPIVSATQTTRSGFGSSDIELTDTSESFGLPATADLMFALISTEELDQLGQIMVKQLKNRYSDPTAYKRFVLGIDRSKMRLYDVEQSAQKDILDSGQEEEYNKEDKKFKKSFEGFKF